MFYFQNTYDLDFETLDHSANGYAVFLNKYYQFEICENGELENRVEKIVLYEDENNDWTHIARQLGNGHWTSKMGRLEDIEHYTIESLSGSLYGNPVIFMKRLL